MLCTFHTMFPTFVSLAPVALQGELQGDKEGSLLHKYPSANAELAAALSRGDFYAPTSPAPLAQRPQVG